MVVAALPPDVRKGSAFPIRFFYFDRGYTSNLSHSLTFRTVGSAATSPALRTENRVMRQEQVSISGKPKPGCH